jgi:hypothetical protein
MVLASLKSWIAAKFGLRRVFIATDYLLVDLSSDVGAR